MHDDEGNQRSTADLARALSNVLQKLDGKQANELGKQLNLDASVIEALRNPVPGTGRQRVCRPGRQQGRRRRRTRSSRDDFRS